MEQAIKLIALLRKNALFFMTAHGAWISDVILSVGATAGGAEVNLYGYFVELLRYRELVEKDPAAFLPWEYQKTVAHLREQAARDPTKPPPRVRELSAQQWQERQARLVEIRALRKRARLSPAA